MRIERVREDRLGRFASRPPANGELEARRLLDQTWSSCQSRRALVELAIRSRATVENSTLGESIAYFLATGGKRFRPVLTLLACEAVGGEPQRALDAACAVEFVHASSLILDDLPCMDNADERRGAPTLHRRFGEAIAVLTAIYFLNKAYELAIASRRGDDWLPLGLTRCVGEQGMVVGQILDLNGGRADDLARRMKTGALIQLAVEVGARVGGAADSALQSLSGYGERLGFVFQVRDDILDGDEGSESARAIGELAEEAMDLIRGSLKPSEARSALEGLALFSLQRRF